MGSYLYEILDPGPKAYGKIAKPQNMKLLQSIRSLIRFFAGLLFWLNALLIVSVSRPSLDAFGSRIGLNPSETILIFFFIAMAALNSYGFRKFLIDVLSDLLTYPL
jgi:hypothetical protein